MRTKATGKMYAQPMFAPEHRQRTYASAQIVQTRAEQAAAA
jgi:hypothetical protein